MRWWCQCRACGQHRYPTEAVEIPLSLHPAAQQCLSAQSAATTCAAEVPAASLQRLHAPARAASESASLQRARQRKVIVIMNLDYEFCSGSAR